MKLRRVVTIAMVGLLVLGFLAGEVFGERPPIAHWRSEVIWGDPDYPLAKEVGRESVLFGSYPEDRGVVLNDQMVTIHCGYVKVQCMRCFLDALRHRSKIPRSKRGSTSTWKR